MIDSTVSVSLEQLCWTTREGVAATLLAIADGASQEAARRAVILLRSLATPAVAPHLLRLARRSDRSADMRRRALDAFVATGAALPEDARALLDELREAPPPEDGVMTPAERLACARELALPLPLLIEALGADGLSRALRAAIHDYSFHLRCPVDRESDTVVRYGRARWVLAEWREGPAIVLRLLRRAVLHPEVEVDLAETLVRGCRDWGRRRLAARLRDPAALPEIRAIVRVLHGAPQSDDRAVLRAALALSDVEVRCLAIEALDALQEDGDAYRDILRALAGRPEPMVRLCAARALALRGEARFAAVIFAAHTDPDFDLRAFALAALTALTALAQRGSPLREACTAALADSVMADPGTRLRAEAVRCLARLPGVADHMALFEKALFEDPGREGYDDPIAPVRLNAALALGVAGGERARDALLRAAFTGSSYDFCAVSAALDVLVACPEGPPSERLELLRSSGESFSRFPYRLTAREVEP